MHGLSVRAKVFFLFAGGTLLTMLPALWLIREAVEDRVYERATEELMGAGDALRSYWTLQDEALRESSRRLALEREVSALMQSGDTAALRKVLRAEVSGRRVVLASDTLGVALVGPTLDAETLNGGGSVVIVPPGETPVRATVWPVYADRAAADSVPADSLAPLPDSVRIGVVGVGSPFDSATVRGLKEALGGAEVALVIADSVVATTLPDSLARVLERMDLRMVMERGEGIWRREVERLPYLYSVHPVRTREAPAAVLLFRPVAQELRLAAGIGQSLVGIGLVALALALVLALVVSRIVARPAQTLAAAATDLARGQFDAPLPTASGDEIGQLTRSFGDMRAAIAEREQRLRSAQAELIHREKLAAMGRLVAQLSHEINNPIYNIQNCLEVLDRRGDPNDPNREFLELAREELGRMAILTRQMLDQSRPVSDAARPLSLNQVAQRVITLARPELERREIRADLQLDPELPTVVAHPDAIQQVLANLVQNAIDAMPAGGTLRLHTRARDEAVEMVVEDSGSGISTEHLPHIFDAFYTTKPGVRGIGLGLFVSEGIIRGHRGRLSVESRVGAGSCFLIQLPRETLGTTSSVISHQSTDD